MDKRIKDIKISLNKILGIFEFPEFARATAALSFGLESDEEEEEKNFFAKTETFERKFKNPETREKLLFSEDEFEKLLISQLPKDIFVWTAFRGSSVLQKYYSDTAARELDEKTVKKAFEYYYSTDEDNNDYEGKLFLLWHIVTAEKLPESVLSELEEFIKI